MGNFGAVVVGMGFGDEGKGTITDFLCSHRQVDYVIRYSGGPQTAHNVVTADGKHHTFAQFGSGTFQGVPTILSRYMLVNPFNMVVEAGHLFDKTGSNPMETTYISENALMITPLHVAVNRYREELRGSGAHGSCGEGIGETRSWAIRNPEEAITIGHLSDAHSNNWNLLKKNMSAYLAGIQKELPGFVYNGSIDAIIEGYQNMIQDCQFNIVADDWISQRIRLADYVVFEGSQGILLDEDFGFHPHTTWSAVTDRNARTLVEEAGRDYSSYERIGITRTYATRHGFGPFPSEFEGDKWQEHYPEDFNAYGRYQGSWRAGLLDLTLLEYAVKVNKGFDSIALTHADINVTGVVIGYKKFNEIAPVEEADLDYQETLTNMLNASRGEQIIKPVFSADEVIQEIEQRLGVPVRIVSSGATANDKVIR